MSPENEAGRGPLAPFELRKLLPNEAVTMSDGLGWVGLEAARYRAAPAWEHDVPALTHHRLVLFTRPPQELELRFETVKLHAPPPAGAIILVPAGTPGRVRWSGGFDWLHIYLEPGLVAQVAAEAFGLDPARLPARFMPNNFPAHSRRASTAGYSTLASMARYSPPE